MQGLYLKVKLGRGVNFQKIGTGNLRFSLFKVSYKCKEVNQLYNSDLRPDGVQLQYYYEQGKMVMVGQISYGAAEDLSLSTASIGSHEPLMMTVGFVIQLLWPAFVLEGRE